MHFTELSHQLTSLKDLLNALTNEQYVQKINFLGDATIGAHTRHIIEMIKCMTTGYSVGKIDYINRERNLNIEQNIVDALTEIEKIKLDLHLPDKQLELVTESTEHEKTILLSTTYFREMEYNKEHTIHHLALIKVALREMDLNLVNESFGVARSTLKYMSMQKQIQC